MSGITSKTIIEDLAKSGLTVGDVEAAGWYELGTHNILAKLKEIIGFASINGNNLAKTCTSFLVLPYHRKDFARVRLYPPVDGTKYLQPRNVPVQAYIPDEIWELRKKPNRPIVITEGEKKTLCLLKHNYNTVGLSGVYCFRNKSGELLDDLQAFDWRGRTVHICFDSDAIYNKQVRQAEIELAIRLWLEGAKAYIVRLPQPNHQQKQGVDDFIVNEGIETFQRVVKQAKPLHAAYPFEYSNEIVSVLAKLHSGGTIPLFALKKLVQQFAATWKTPARDLFKHILKSANKDKDPDDFESVQEKIVQQLNKRHAVVMLGGKCCILNETIDPVFKRPDITFSTITDFRNKYANLLIYIPRPDGQGMEEVEAAKVWLRSAERREYEGVVFDPSGEGADGFFNLFRGLGVEPREGNCEKFLNHIYEVICDENEKHFEFVIGWMAHKLQNLGKKKSEICIVLRGERGAGKGVFVQGFGRIFGNHFVHIANQQHLVGRFNSHLKDALLVYVDEAVWGGDKAAEGVLKALITEETVVIEYKGKDAITVRNHMNFIMASNNKWVVPAGFKERRFFVLDVSDRYVKNHDYFKKVVDELEKNDGREALLYYLLNYDLTGFNPNEFPITNALIEQIMRTMPTAHKWWFSELQQESSFFGGWVASKELYDRYLDFCSQIRERHPLSRELLFKELRKIWPADVKKTRPRSGGGARTIGYQFPSLAECRNKFENQLGSPIDWE